MPTKVRGRRTLQHPSGRGEILKAAIPAFGRYGFEGTSLRQLAKEAEVDASLIVHLFGSKMGLWRATLCDLREEVERDQDFFKSLQSSLPVQERLDLLVRWIIKSCRARPYFGVIVLRESLIGGDRLELLIDLLLKPLYAQFEAILNEAIEAGVVLQENAGQLFSSLFDGIAFRVASRGVREALSTPAHLDEGELIYLEIKQSVYRKPNG